ncbi:HNH endonuclease signature motif containing protein [Microbacterium gilvum]|uniref:HNH nuclease domain-containing protein n=1 Tax=Microbacterium gilvum TaxID=1336204 RepID=A0ABP9A9U6_9MICO
MASRKPRFVDGSSWEATPAETRTLRNVRDLVLELRADRARLDGLEAGAFAAAAQVADAQTARCGDASEYAFPWRSIALELATALHLSPGEVEARLRHDHVLTHRFPLVAGALSGQVITRRQADIIREHGEPLPDQVVEEYSRRSVTYAEDATPGQVRVFVKRLAAQLDPAPLPERHRRAIDRRGTRVRVLGDGLAEFVLTDEVMKVAAIHDRLTAIAKPIAAEEKRIATEERKRRDAEEKQRRDAAGASAGMGAAGSAGAVNRIVRNAFGMWVNGDGVAVDANGYATHPDARPGTGTGADRTTYPRGGSAVMPGTSSPRDTARSNTHGPATDRDAHPDDAGPTNGDRRIVRSPLPGCSMVRERTEVFHDGTWYPYDPALPLKPTDEQIAASVERTRDARSRDQIRADLATDLLLTGAPTSQTVDGSAEKAAAIRGTVAVVIPATSLAGLDDGPAMLAGYGPLPADVARRFARDAPGWERVFQNPDTGALVTVDHYTPTAAIRRLINLRDDTCRAPGCPQPAHRCEKDHTTEWERGGPTCAGNLSALCTPHHQLRHHSPWRIAQPEPGVIVWTSPLGYEYVTDPPPQVAHTAAHAPLPPDLGMPEWEYAPVTQADLDDAWWWEYENGLTDQPPPGWDHPDPATITTATGEAPPGGPLSGDADL